MAGMLRIGAVLGAGLLASSCTSIVGHRGYLADEVLLQSVQPGVDNRTSVERALGHPSFESQFGQPTWYYVGSTTGQKPFTTPRITDQAVLAVKFDPAGNVASTERFGIDQVARISPEDDETPTLGRERSFLEDLFGNIGQVGTGAGAGAGRQGGGGGGG
jgi:outer membrane protein assembly factor BamE (lipoprotein component of BamABCDE complex)